MILWAIFPERNVNCQWLVGTIMECPAELLVAKYSDACVGCCALNAWADGIHLLVWLCPIAHPGSTTGGFLALNVDYFLQWMIALHWMDLLFGGTGWSWTGGMRARGGQYWVSTLLATMFTGMALSEVEIKRDHPFSYLNNHICFLRYYNDCAQKIREKKTQQSRSHNEMYQSSDKKGDSISQSYVLLPLNTGV